MADSLRLRAVNSIAAWRSKQITEVEIRAISSIPAWRSDQTTEVENSIPTEKDSLFTTCLSIPGKHALRALDQFSNAKQVPIDKTLFVRPVASMPFTTAVPLFPR